jgi:hypothetical protein
MSRTIARSLIVIALSTLAALPAFADATGKWTWTVTVNGQERKQTLELKQDGTNLTGNMLGRNDQKTPITDGKVDGNNISFAVVRSRNGQEVKVLYKATIDGDTMKGTTIFNANGQEQKREFTAKREP